MFLGMSLAHQKASPDKREYIAPRLLAAAL
jgi:hypothetical protein